MNWKQSEKIPDAIVTDNPTDLEPESKKSIDYYGGHVIAESVPPPFRNLIAAAPDLLYQLKIMLQPFDGIAAVAPGTKFTVTYTVEQINEALKAVNKALLK